MWIIVSFFVYSCQSRQNTINYDEVLWYEYPAKYWNSQGLHLGNGYFGATFFGGQTSETFSLTEGSMWTGEPAMGRWEKAGVNPRALSSLPEIRKATFSGNAKLADSLIASDFYGSGELYGHFTSIGDLKINFLNHEGSTENYRRSLNLSESIGSVSYTLNGIKYEREYFCSYPDRILGMRISASQPGSISFNISAEILQDSSIVKINDNVFKVNRIHQWEFKTFCCTA